MLRWTTVFLPIILILGGCTSNVEPPKLSQRYQRIPLEACKKTSVDLRQLKTDSIRNFFLCINGEDGAVQPYVDLLNNSLNDKELTVLLSIYNKHMVKENRFKKLLGYIEAMNTRGFTDEIYQNIFHLTKTTALTDFLPVLRRLYESRDHVSQPDEAIVFISRFIVELIDRDLMTDTLLAFARLLSGGRARIVAKNLSTPLDVALLSSDYFVDSISDSIYRSIETKGFRELAILGLDPKVFDLLQSILKKTPGTSAELNSFIAANVKDTATSKSKIRDIIQLVRRGQMPIECFTDAKIKSFYQVAVSELVPRSTNFIEFEKYFLGEASVLLSLIRNQCQIPSSISKGVVAAQDLVRQGYGRNIALVLNETDVRKRIDYLTELLVSPEVGALATSVHQVYLNNSLPYLLDIFQNEISLQDFQNLSNISTLLMVDDLAGERLKNWLFRYFSKTDARVLWGIADTNSLDLIELLRYLDIQSVYDPELSAKLRFKIARVEFEHAPETEVLPFFQKIFSPNPTYRTELKTFVRALIRSWNLPKHGFGDLMGSAAEALAISVDTPIQDFLRDLLTDQNFISDINPILYKLFSDPLFLKAVEFTGELAGNGELKRLIDFFVALGTSIDVPGLSPVPMPNSFVKFRGDINSFIKDYSFEPVPPVVNFDACNIANIPLFSSDARNLLQALHCASEVYGNELLLRVGRVLDRENFENSSLFTELSAGIGQYFFSGEPGKKVFAQLKELQRTGYLDEFLSALSLGLKSPYDFEEKLMSIAEPMLKEDGFDHALESAGFVLQHPDLQEYSKSLLELIWQSNEKVFVSVPDFKTVIHGDLNKLKEKAKEWQKDLSPVELNASDFMEDGDPIPSQNYFPYANKQEEQNSSSKEMTDEEFEKEFQLVVTEYQDRSEHYYHRQGAYPAPFSNSQEKLLFFQEQFTLLFKQTVRPGFLQGLINVFKNLDEENFDFEGFFNFATKETEIIRYWTGSRNSPSLRMVTVLDQLELLVQNADLAVAAWFPVFGVDHIGTHFQLEIAKTKSEQELDKTLKRLRKSIDMGINYTSFWNKKWKRNKLRNIRENFPSLQKLQDKGYFKFFYYAYKYMREATPEKYRNEKTPENQYMASLHFPTRLAFMASMIQGVQNLEQQKILKYLAFILNNILLDIKDDEVAILNSTFENLLIEHEGKNLLSHIIAKLWPIFDSPDAFTKFKESLLPFLYMGLHSTEEVGALLKVMNILSAKPDLLLNIFDVLLEEMTVGSNAVYSLGNNYFYFDQPEQKLFTDFNSYIFSTDTKLLPSLMSSVSHTWLDTKEFYPQLRESWREFREDIHIAAISWYDIFYDVLSSEKTFGGLEHSLGGFLQNRKNRQALLKSLVLLRREGLFEDLVSELEKNLDSEKLMELFNLLSKSFSFEKSTYRR